MSGASGDIGGDALICHDRAAESSNCSGIRRRAEVPLPVAPVGELTELHCPLCMDLPEGQIEQCVHGHIFCSECLTAHKESGRDASQKCPTCRVALGSVPIRNRIAESAVGQLPGPCDGCGSSMLRKDLAAHGRTCPEVLVPCSFKGCTARVRRKNLDAQKTCGAAEMHCELNNSNYDELVAARATLASLDLQVKLKLDSGRAVALTLKRFEPIDAQREFIDAVANFPRLRTNFDVTKTPHELKMRDGHQILYHTVADDLQATQINIKVISPEGDEVFFKCKMSTQLQRLMLAYTNRHNIAPSSVRFMYANQRIHGEFTPAQLGMEDGDVIDCLNNVQNND